MCCADFGGCQRERFQLGCELPRETDCESVAMLRDELNEALKTAMKAKDERTVSTLRMVNAAIKDKDIAARPKGVTSIPDDEVRALMQNMIRQRRDSIVMYEKAARPELVKQESDEIAI